MKPGNGLKTVRLMYPVVKSVFVFCLVIVLRIKSFVIFDYIIIRIFSEYLFLVLSNEGEECYEKCGHKQGECSWCGSKGMCCSQNDNWNDTSYECDGTFGGMTRHECVLKPGVAFKVDIILTYFIITLV